MGVDYVGPEPMLLTFTSGQSMGDVQCASVTILDDTILSGQRNLSIRLILYQGGIGSGVRIDQNMSSINVLIDDDTDDGKLHRCRLLVYKSQHLSKKSQDLIVCG